MAEEYARVRSIIGAPADWAAHPIVLGEGEIGIESGHPPRLKVGDGAHPWPGLPYIGGGWSIKGPIDQTAAAPTAPSEGDTYVASVTGKPDSSFAMGGYIIAANSLLLWDGSHWRMIPGEDQILEVLKEKAVDSSSGLSDAGKIVQLDVSGKISDTMLEIPEMVSTSAGAADHDKLALLDTNGKLDLSFITIGGGMQFLGNIDVTTPMTGTHNPGEYYIVGADGTADASYTGIAGKDLHKGDSIIYGSGRWYALPSIHDLDSLIGATEATTGTVQLATDAELDAGTSKVRVPSVFRLVEWFRKQLATATDAGIVKIATKTTMDAGTDGNAVPSVKIIADWVKAHFLAKSSASSTYALRSRKILPGSGLTGGGDLTADRHLAVSFASASDANAGTSSTKVMNPKETKTAIYHYAYARATADGRFAPKTHSHSQYFLKSKIHISHSGPSGGSSGDIWFRY